MPSTFVDSPERPAPFDQLQLQRLHLPEDLSEQRVDVRIAVIGQAEDDLIGADLGKRTEFVHRLID